MVRSIASLASCIAPYGVSDLLRCPFTDFFLPEEDRSTRQLALDISFFLLSFLPRWPIMRVASGGVRT